MTQRGLPQLGAKHGFVSVTFLHFPHSCLVTPGGSVAAAATIPVSVSFLDPLVVPCSGKASALPDVAVVVGGVSFMVRDR